MELTKNQQWEQLVIEALRYGHQDIQTIEKIIDTIIRKTNSINVDRIKVRIQVILAIGRSMKIRDISQHQAGKFRIASRYN